MKKKIILIIIVAILLYLVYYVWNGFKPNTTIPILSSYKTKMVKIGSNNFNLYIADSDNKQEQGLSNVTFMPKNTGMIFVFKKPDKYYFWMKDMMFSLDFVFIRNNVIVDSLENIEPETYPKSFTSNEPFDSVIEFNSGQIASSNILIGSTITFIQ